MMCTKSRDDCNIREFFEMPQPLKKLAEIKMICINLKIIKI